MARYFGCWLSIAAAALAVVTSAWGEPTGPAEPPVRTDSRGDPLPVGAIARLGTARLRHRGGAAAIAYAPDGRALASADSHGPVRLWEADTGKEIRCLGRERRGNNGSHAVVFTPDGKNLASYHYEGTIILWDIATGQEVRRFPGPRLPPFSGHLLAVSPDGSTLAAGTEDHAVCLWELATGKEVRKFTGHQRQVTSVTFSPDGKILVAGALDQTVRLWDVATGQQLHKLAASPNLALAPDGKVLATWSGYSKLQLWDMATGEVLQEVSDQRGYPSGPVAFAPDGRTLAWVDAKTNTFHLWDRTAHQEARQWAGGTSRIGSLAFAPDGKTLASACGNGFVRLWDVAIGQEKNAEPGHRGSIGSLAFTPDGKTLVTASHDSVWLWDTATAKQTGSLPATQPVALSPDGRLLATSSRDRNEHTVVLWDFLAGKPVRKYAGHQNVISILKFSADSKRLASGSWDQTIRQWDTVTGQVLGQLRDPQGSIYAVAWSPDGKTLATGAYSKTVRLWDVASGKENHLLEGHERPVAALAFSRDGQILVTGGYDSTVRFWEVASGTETHVLSIADNTVVYALAFSPDGQVLATGSYDETVRLWEVVSRRLIGAFSGHERSINSVAFAPDGRTLVSGSGDSTVLIWDVTGRLRGGRLEPVHLSAPELEARWTALADADAGSAQTALWTLVQAAGQSEAYLKERLRPVLPPSPQRLQQLLTDLDNKQFDVRNRASYELEKLGELGADGFRQALAGKPGLEVRQRLEHLLRMAEDPAQSPERLRSLRAVRVLEQIGTADARALLELLATGAEGARLTQEAKAAVKRLVP